MKFVLDAKLLPLVLSHLVEGQHIDSFDVTERSSEGRETIDVFRIVGQTRHKHETKPNWSFAGSQTPREG